MIKTIILSVLGIAGSAITTALGGWDTGLTTLVIFMAVDYLSGLVVAGVFKASPKTETGALESRAGFKGLWRKGMMLFVVLVATRLDMMIGTGFVRDAVVIGYVANEAISIVENAGLMGVPVPKVITKAIDVLNKRDKEE